MELVAWDGEKSRYAPWKATPWSGRPSTGRRVHRSAGGRQTAWPRGGGDWSHLATVEVRVSILPRPGLGASAPRGRSEQLVQRRFTLPAGGRTGDRGERRIGVDPGVGPGGARGGRFVRDGRGEASADSTGDRARYDHRGVELGTLTDAAFAETLALLSADLGSLRASPSGHSAAGRSPALSCPSGSTVGGLARRRSTGAGRPPLTPKSTSFWSGDQSACSALRLHRRTVGQGSEGSGSS